MAIIALNGRLLISGKLEGIGWFAHQCFQRMVSSHPEHEFFLFVDRKPKAVFDYGENCKTMVLAPPARRTWLYDAWFDYAVPWALKRVGADVFVSPDGFASRRCPCRQLVVIHDLNFLHHPEWLPRRAARFYNKRVPEYARLADRVVTVSEFSRRDLTEQFGLDPALIEVVPNAPSSLFRPLSIEEQAHVRATQNQGRPYFIYVGSLHPRKNIDGMLEAYRRYRELTAESSGGCCELLIVGEGLFKEVRLQADGVRLLGRKSQEELARLVGAAQALIFLPHFEGFGVPVVEAFAAGTPVIASNTTSIPEVANGAAAALVSPTDHEAAARAMIQIDTDAIHAQYAIQRGLARSAQFSWARSAERFWSILAPLLDKE